MSPNEPIKLYQFPISHYCEKVRWALDFKALDYKKINCLPGLHTRTTKKLAKHSSVPILQQGKTVIQGSANIIDYLEQHFPQKPLGFSDHALNDQALAWERFADEHIGPHVRRIMYHHLLNHPDLVIPIFSHEGPWYSKLYFKLSYSKLNHIMRKLMQINDEKVAQSTHTLNAAFARLQEASSTKDAYLVGQRFSRADLAVSALLAPLFLPAAYGVQFPVTIPANIETLLKHYKPQLGFAEYHYTRHR